LIFSFIGVNINLEVRPPTVYETESEYKLSPRC